MATLKYLKWSFSFLTNKSLYPRDSMLLHIHDKLCSYIFMSLPERSIDWLVAGWSCIPWRSSLNWPLSFFIHQWSTILVLPYNVQLNSYVSLKRPCIKFFVPIIMSSTFFEQTRHFWVVHDVYIHILINMNILMISFIDMRVYTHTVHVLYAS